MSQGVNVRSFESLKVFRSAFVTFGEDAGSALEEARMELNRFLDWILEDQPRYWRGQVRQRQEKLAQAKADLARKKTTAPEGAAREQQTAVRKAKQRVEEAEEMIVVVQKWGRRVQDAVREYDSHARRMEQVLERDQPEAEQRLGRMLEALEAYLAIQAPDVRSSSGAGSLSSVRQDVTESEEPRPPAPSANEDEPTKESE
ncbi:hypothetical protein Pan216_23060 [Planctomycetes bacterium Pan216]|uniref:Uncharacterized protein n=1 Tax=Kolteria novifilia TaxID=2527975 RepID=A0A518B382_9BACT|nr:hypothetical protein Pan216_23060 [Planctomycetes bacterium Pan216]